MLERSARTLSNGYRKASYQVRYVVHQNSAFGLPRALPHARARDSVLCEAVTSKPGNGSRRTATTRPSSNRQAPISLSPALTEAGVMAQLLLTDALC
jgi:hypothetical protein